MKFISRTSDIMTYRLSRKIKILATVPWGEWGIGGSGRSVATILNNLDKDKFDIYLVRIITVRKKNKQNFENIVSPHIKIYSINVSRGIKSIWKLRAIITKVNPDIIYSNTIHINTDTLIAKWLSFSKAKFISCIRGIDFRKFIEKVQLFFDSLFSDKIITISNGLRKELVQKFKINPQKVKTIYNPVIDYLGFNQKLEEPLNKIEKIWPNNKLNIIGIGRLEIEKGFTYLIKAIGIIIEKYKRDINLILVGDGSKRGELEELVRELGIENNVFFTGWRNNVFQYLKEADIFVSPSLSEGFGRTIVEAMACGLPVISTDCPFSPREILAEGKYGILVPVANPEILSKEILKLLDNSKLRKKYSQLSKGRAKDFSVDKIIEKYENVFVEI